MSEKKKLTRAERKQIEAAIARANRTDKKEKSAQDSIPYQRMWPDGICRVTDTRYTKTIQYQDINYQLSQNEDKTAIFEAWCDFLNYFDSSVQFQLSFVNLSASQETFARSISIPPCGDEFDGIRAEYAGMLQNQLARGNNGLIKTKYLTFGVEADNLRAAKPRLERIETDLLNNFKRLGVVAAPLNGFERLHVMHDILRMDEQEPFRFSWDWLAPSGLSTKDFIAPSSFEFKTGRQFRMGKKLGAVSFVQILAPELNDRMLADFLDMESSVLVNLHVQSVDQVNAIKTVKRKITDLDKSKIEEQKKAVRAGYDMDIIPSDLATYGAEAKKLLQDLQSRNERMFLLTFLILNTADTPRQLDNNIFQTSSIAQKYNCALTRLDFQQEEGLIPSSELTAFLGRTAVGIDNAAIQFSAKGQIAVCNGANRNTSLLHIIKELHRCKTAAVKSVKRYDNDFLHAVLMDCCKQILKRRTLCGQAAVSIVHEEHIGVRSVFLRMAQKSVHLIVKVQVCLFVRRTVVICGDFVGLLFHVASYSGSRTNRLFILYQGSRSPSLGGFKIICNFFTPQVILNQAAHLCHGVLFRAVFDDGLDDIRYIPDLVLAYNRGRCYLHGFFHRNKSPFHGKRNNYKGK